MLALTGAWVQIPREEGQLGRGQRTNKLNVLTCGTLFERFAKVEETSRDLPGAYEKE